MLPYDGWPQNNPQLVVGFFALGCWLILPKSGFYSSFSVQSTNLCLQLCVAAVQFSNQSNEQCIPCTIAHCVPLYNTHNRIMVGASYLTSSIQQLSFVRSIPNIPGRSKLNSLS